MELKPSIENIRDLITTFLIKNRIKNTSNITVYLNKENNIVKIPKKYKKRYSILKQISTKVSIFNIVKELDQIKIVSQLFEGIVSYYGKIKNIMLILPKSKNVEELSYIENIKMMNKVLLYLQKIGAYKNLVLLINRKSYFYFEGNNYRFLTPLLEFLTYDSITFIIDDYYFQNFYGHEVNIAITENFKIFLNNQTNIKYFSMKSLLQSRQNEHGQFFQEFFYCIIDSIPKCIKILKLNIPFIFFFGKEEKEKNLKEIKKLLFKISQYENLKINKTIFPLFSLIQFSNKITNLEIYMCGEFSLGGYQYSKFYDEPNNYSWDNFTCLEKLTLNDSSKNERKDCCQYDKFLNLENIVVSSLTLKTCAFSQEDFIKRAQNLTINQNVSEIHIILKKAFNTYEEISLFKDDFLEKIRKINPNIILKITSDNIISSIPLVHHQINVESEFYLLLYAIEISKKKNYTLKKIHKFPILKSLKSFFNDSYCSYDIFVNKFIK